MLQDIPAVLAFAHWFDHVERELEAQLMFERDLERLALSLLRTLLCLALQTGDLVAQLRDGVVAILHLEIESRLRFGNSLCTYFTETGSDAFLNIEREFPFTIFKCLLLLQQISFCSLRRCELGTERLNAFGLQPCGVLFGSDVHRRPAAERGWTPVRRSCGVRSRVAARCLSRTARAISCCCF